MKKIFFYVMMLFMMVAVPATFVSCGDDEEEVVTPDGSDDTGDDDAGDDSEGGNDGDDGNNDTPGEGEDDTPAGEVLPVSEQKERLESAAMELMGKISATDFTRIVDLVEYVGELDGDSEEVDEWAEAAMEACVLSSSTESDIKCLWKVANFHGEFTLKDGSWELVSKNVNYLKFNFKDEAGTSCYVKLTHSDNGTKVHHDEFDSEDYDWYYDYENDEYYEEYTYIKNTFVIPESITLKLVQGSKTLVTANVKTKLTLKSGPEFNYATDVVNISTTYTIEDYTIAVDKLNYSKGKKGDVSAKFTKNGETLMSFSVTAEGDVTNEDNMYGGVKKVSYKLLDDVEIKGSLLDINKLEKYLEKLNDWDVAQNESEFKGYLNSANELIDLGLYFDGKSTSDASLKLYPFYEEDYYDSWWTYEGVIMFPDGSSHSLLKNYFDEIFFDNVINKFEGLVSDFEKEFGADDDDYYEDYY